MTLHCDIVRDLLAGYLDNTCSQESRMSVEEHLHTCEACRNLLEELRQEPGVQMPELTLDEKEVMKNTYWAVGKRAVAAAAGVTMIVIYWIVHFWQDHLANWGDYRFFPYRFHELWSGGVVIVPVVTAVWLAAVVWRSFRHKTWRQNAVLLCALFVLAAAQTGWWGKQSGSYNTYTTTVIEIVDESHICLKNSGVVLEVSPKVMNLLREDVAYTISYHHQELGDKTGTLYMIRLSDIPPEHFE